MTPDPIAVEPKALHDNLLLVRGTLKSGVNDLSKGEQIKEGIHTYSSGDTWLKTPIK